jgi:hypothetical protein
VSLQARVSPSVQAELDLHTEDKISIESRHVWNGLGVNSESNPQSIIVVPLSVPDSIPVLWNRAKDDLLVQTVVKFRMKYYYDWYQVVSEMSGHLTEQLQTS